MKLDNIGEIDPSNVTVISRSEVRGIIESLGTKKFLLGYVTVSDHRYRVFHAQTRVNKYKLSPGSGKLQGQHLILLYDTDIASEIASAYGPKAMNSDGTINEEWAIDKEIELRAAYRRIVPENVEIIKCNKIWIVDTPTISEIDDLLYRIRELRNPESNSQEITQNASLSKSFDKKYSYLEILKNSLKTKI